MISKTAEYALRAVVHLAERGGRPCTLESIASEIQAPRGYLGKVMQSLVRRGLASSQRGLHGGFALVARADEMTALDVINAVDPPRRHTDLRPADPEPEFPVSPLHDFLSRLSGLIEERSRQTTIADLMNPQRGEISGR